MFVHRLMARTWYWGIIISTAYSAVVVYLDNQNLDWLIFPSSIPAILGTAVSLLLAFRTNSAYDRWWEARKIWGSIVNDSRSLIRQATTFVDMQDSAQKKLVTELTKLQIAWCWALNKELRKQEVLPAIKKFLNQKQIDYVLAHLNAHNAILQLMGEKIKDLYSKNYINVYQYMNMDNLLTSQSNHMGVCERISNTVFPLQYSFTLHLSVIAFTLVFPMGIASTLSWTAVPITFIVATIFYLIKSIASRIQDPFTNYYSDTPMDSISRTIEINLNQQIGNYENLPSAIPADKYGVLL